MPEEAKIEKKRLLTANKVDLSKMTENIGKFTQKVDSLGKFFDWVIVEAMPKIFDDKIEEAYENSKKQIDYAMRHLI